MENVSWSVSTQAPVNLESASTDPTPGNPLHPPTLSKELVTADHDLEGMAEDACLVDFEEVPDTSYDPRQDIPALPLRDEDATFGENFSFLQDTGGNTSEQGQVVLIS